MKVKVKNIFRLQRNASLPSCLSQSSVDYVVGLKPPPPPKKINSSSSPDSAIASGREYDLHYIL